MLDARRETKEIIIIRYVLQVLGVYNHQGSTHVAIIQDRPLMGLYSDDTIQCGQRQKKRIPMIIVTLDQGARKHDDHEESKRLGKQRMNLACLGKIKDKNLQTGQTECFCMLWDEAPVF